jgi:hypothetical protein
VFQRLFAHSDTHFSASARAPTRSTLRQAGGDSGRRLSASAGERNITVARAERVCAADFRAEGVCRVSDRPYDVRLYKMKMLDQLIHAFFGSLRASSVVPSHFWCCVLMPALPPVHVHQTRNAQTAACT